MLKQHNKICRLTALLLALTCICTLAPSVLADPTAAADYSDTIVRTGLAYGSGSLAAANFQVASGTGTGFEAGYYGSDRLFVPLYTIAGETELTVIRSQNYSLASSS